MSAVEGSSRRSKQGIFLFLLFLTVWLVWERGVPRENRCIIFQIGSRRGVLLCLSLIRIRRSPIQHYDAKRSDRSHARESQCVEWKLFPWKCRQLSGGKFKFQETRLRLLRRDLVYGEVRISHLHQRAPDSNMNGELRVDEGQQWFLLEHGTLDIHLLGQTRMKVTEFPLATAWNESREFSAQLSRSRRFISTFWPAGRKNWRLNQNPLLRWSRDFSEDDDNIRNLQKIDIENFSY